MISPPNGWDGKIFFIANGTRSDKVLSYYWPKAISYHDIKKTDFTIHRGGIDILTGGFPCQPYSQAGKRLGKDDERHLWPEMLRAVREIAPTWVVGENVRGLLNWNGGLVFDEVQTDLENLGYEVLPFLLPAAGVNAPHERYRIVFIAYSHDAGTRKRLRDDGKPSHSWKNGNKGNVTNSGRDNSRSENKSKQSSNNITRCNIETSSDPSGGCKSWELQPQPQQFGRYNLNYDSSDLACVGGNKNERFGNGESNVVNENGPPTTWEEFPTQSPVCNGDDGFSSRLDFEAIFEKIPFPRKPLSFGKWRNESIAAGGNAIVPQLFLQVFKAIEEYEINNRTA